MDGLTIRQCEDLKSYKKLIPALEAYPDHYIVTADDDLVYPPSWLREMVDAHFSQKHILLRRARAIGMAVGDNRPTPYNTWSLINQPNTEGIWHFPTSCHGMLVPPGAFSQEVMDMEKAQRLCPTNDDIWWYWMAHEAGSTFRVIEHADPIYDLPTGKEGLWSEHNRDGGNDKQIAAMIEAYGLPWARVNGAVQEAAE
jgi:hypothetical protein